MRDKKVKNTAEKPLYKVLNKGLEVSLRIHESTILVTNSEDFIREFGTIVYFPCRKTRRKRVKKKLSNLFGWILWSLKSVSAREPSFFYDAKVPFYLRLACLRQASHALRL